MKHALKFCIVIALVLFSALVGRTWYWAKDGFHILRIRTAFPGLENPQIDAATLAIFDQPFHYVGRGRQCYAFASQDDQYILKIPRLDRYETPLWGRVLCPSLMEDLRKDHDFRLQFILNSFQIAANEMKEATGTVYLHLHRSDHLGKKVRLTDRVKRSYTIDLDKTAFVLQEKKPLFLPAFKNAKTPEEAQKILSAFLDAVYQRASKGILNKDGSFRRNYGYDGQRCIQIDIGSFYTQPGDPQMAFEKSIHETMEPFERWLREYDPQLAAWFHVQLLVSDCKNPRTYLRPDLPDKQSAERESNLHQVVEREHKACRDKDGSNMTADFCNQTLERAKL